MNIVDEIKSQLDPTAIGKLSSLLQENEEGIRSAVEAAVPGLLSLLSQLASTSEGGERLINSLKQVQQEPQDGQGGFGDILGGPRAPEIQEKGTSLINILLGSAAIPVLLNLLSKFAKISPGAVKGLLGYLAPLILGMIAKQFGGGSLSAQSLSNFFSEQKENISGAMPQGLSLAGIPGLGSAGSAAAAVSSAIKQEGGLPGWLLPLVGLGLLGLLAWWFLSQPSEPQMPSPSAGPTAGRGAPAVAPAAKLVEAAKKVEDALPDPAKLSGDLGAIYTELTTLLGRVKDAATAESNVQALKDLTPRIDGLKTIWDKLPDAARTTVAKVTTDQLTKLKELVAKILALPGVGEKLKPILDTVLEKLASFTVS